MTQYLVKQSKLQGEIAIPPSKSHTLRAILFGSLAKGKSFVRNYLPSTDAQAMIEACRLLGAKLYVSDNTIEIEGINGKLDHTEDVINAGNSGIVLRFCSAIGALASRPVVITGDHSIRHQRPMKPLLDALSQLGANTASMRGDHYAPVIIQGPILSGKAVINGEDSQPVSALLIASAFANQPTEFEVVNPGELPWIDLTLYWFDKLGIKYENKAYQRYRLLGNSSYDGFDYTVPGDFSSAAFPIAAALVTGSELTLKNVDMEDPQGDKELVYVLKKMGADIRINEQTKTLEVKKSGMLKGINIDINNFIDAITILAVVACHAEGETLIHNASVAKQKECNRIQCIATELQKMGADIIETENGLRIRKSTLHGATVNTYNDHRMAMSLAVAAMNAKGETLIAPTSCVSKTFPTFAQNFEALGAKIKVGVF